jgi:PAS domain S-box-containing protein
VTNQPISFGVLLPALEWAKGASRERRYPADGGPSSLLNEVQEKLRQSEERLLWENALLAAQVNSSPDGIVIIDNEGKCILQNQRLIDLWNMPQEIANELDHRMKFEWFAGQVKDRKQFEKRVASLEDNLDEASRFELELADGRFFDRYSAPVLGKDGKRYGRIWTFRDITERKHTEARFRLLVDSNVQGVLFWNRNGKVTGGNDAFLRIVGYSREDLEAGRIDWMAMTPPEYAPLDLRALADIPAKGACTPYEKEYIRQDGTRVPILLGTAAFADDPNEGVSFVIDLTERKKLEQQFLRAQRMESIGTLAGGVAHDLNNILAPIMMSIDILKSTVENPQACEILETIEISAKRGADIVRQVLSFARGLEGERIEVQPKHLLKDLENIIKDTFPKDIRLRFSIPNDMWTIMGDPTQVHQILLNLCVNARDAMPSGGTLTIGVQNATLDEQYAAMNIQAKAGRYIQISVADSGTGIPQNIIDKIFEPFFTTKELTKGTGLGLSTVMGIVKSHEGMINVYSEPGKGTTFNVYLPAVELLSEARHRESQRLNLSRGHGETIMVVDDEASIRTITQRTLQAFGYRVLAASDGAEAVALYAEKKNEIAVVLTDMMMPVMDGNNVIRVLTRINPAIKIVAASGLAVNGSWDSAPGLNIKHFLTKPYTAEALLKIIHAILEEA